MYGRRRGCCFSWLVIGGQPSHRPHRPIYWQEDPWRARGIQTGLLAARGVSRFSHEEQQEQQEQQEQHAASPQGRGHCQAEVRAKGCGSHAAAAADINIQRLADACGRTRPALTIAEAGKGRWKTLRPYNPTPSPERHCSQRAMPFATWACVTVCSLHAAASEHAACATSTLCLLSAIGFSTMRICPVVDRERALDTFTVLMAGQVGP